ncbi:hypothetical protein GGH13_000184 [Coemansia sp. S155-1]|nr:hypothetical protein GGH13_000184 [Coemansia sp. S155-1]
MPVLPSHMNGVLLLWLKSAGESFTTGEVLFQVETEEVVMDVTAENDGVLVKILVEAQPEYVASNTPVAIIAEKGDDPSTVDTTGL